MLSVKSEASFKKRQNTVDIKNNVDNEANIWKVKRKLKKKEQNSYQTINSQDKT